VYDAAFTKRYVWTLGVGFAGFFIGGVGGAVRGSIIGLAWGGSIGYGFGSIFIQKHATKKLIAYWAATLGLVGPLFGLFVGAAMDPYATAVQLTVAGVIGAAAGMLLGLLAGLIQFMSLRRASRVHPGEQAS